MTFDVGCFKLYGFLQYETDIPPQHFQSVFLNPSSLYHFHYRMYGHFFCLLLDIDKLLGGSGKLVPKKTSQHQH